MAVQQKPRKKSRKKARKKRPDGPQVSRTRRPEGMTLEEWQTELRRQFGGRQDFLLENAGEEPFFSDFRVTNPASNNTYRVAIRGLQPGENYCSCPDFATNTLGTCKHIEFTLARLRRKRGAKKAFDQGFEPSYSEVYLQYGAARCVKFRPGSDCPEELARLAAKYFDDEGTLRDKAFGRVHEFLARLGEMEHEVRCYSDVLRFIAEVRDGAARQQKVGELFRDRARGGGFDDLLENATLYPYQREGALFAARAGRCLIADEMGLGKTIQAIAAVEIMSRVLGVERVLVVCPTSLKHQWEREIERFGPRPTLVVGGLRPKREEQYDEPSFYKITNYDTVYRDIDLINGWSPDLVILDEAQRIKNWETRTAQSVKKINSPYAIVLTGTPLENRLEDLVSIVQFVDQQRLGPTFRFLHRHQQRDENGRVIGYQDLDQVGQTLAPVLIRRRKEEVLDQLPERIYKRLFVPMTPLQLQHHDENKDIVGQLVNRWKRQGFLSERDQQLLMAALQKMRMACDSSFLLDHQTDHSIKPDELATLLDETMEDGRTKVVIFSQWVRMHELIQRRINERDWGHVFFHGGVPSKKRKTLIDQFREDDACRVFLSTDAGGVGLNLQHANVVVNVDQPWNPAVLEQRIGRVHRLGQTRTVRIVDFVSSGSIEEGMLEVLKFKRDMFAGVLDGGEKDVFLGESRLKKFMKTVEKVTAAIPEEAELEIAAGNGEPRRDQPPRGGHEEIVDGTRSRRKRGERSGGESQPQPAADPLAGLLQHGLALLEQLAGGGTAAGESTAAGRPSRERRGIQVAEDEQTGRRYLKLDLPEPEVIDQVLQTVRGLFDRLRG